jgi:hypothetical protein
MRTPFTRFLILISLIGASVLNQPQLRSFAQVGDPVITPDTDGGGEGNPGSPPDNGGGSGSTGNPTLPGGPPPVPITDPGPPELAVVDANGNEIVSYSTAQKIVLHCVAQIDGSYADLEFALIDGSWWQTNSTPADAAACNKTNTSATELKEPCAPTAANGTGTVTFSCPGDANTGFARLVLAQASSACPINRVLRHPYPRALVSVDTQFLLQDDEWGTGGAGGNWSNSVDMPSLVEDDSRPTGFNQYKQVTIGVRSFRFSGGEKWFGAVAPKPKWKFTDGGAAGKYATEQKGPVAVFAYEASSFGGDKKGRAFDFDKHLPSETYDLPARPVTIATTCGHQWSMKWKQSSVEYDDHCEGANETDDGKCTSAGGTWKKKRYQWDDKEYTWRNINLTKYGLPTPYVTITPATGGGTFEGKTYWESPSGGIWVPVIEVQSILVRKCVYDGTCEPPK